MSKQQRKKNNHNIRGNETKLPPVNPDELDDIVCPNEDCTGTVWTIGFLLKRVLAMLTKSGNEESIRQGVYCCAKCGARLEGAIPAGL